MPPTPRRAPTTPSPRNSKHRRAGSAAPLADAAAKLLSAARQLDALDDTQTGEAYMEALAAAMYAGRLGHPGAMVEAGAAALADVGRWA
ncbi:hypothetical protein [Mycolicibacterium houstonense]|uniref:hypothetical protein n=1 Tax=Mycolicibacterium houstonense TaxID=146021 RepID=UPI003F9E1C7F